MTAESHCWQEYGNGHVVNLVDYSHNFGVPVVEERLEHHCGQLNLPDHPSVAVKKQTYRLFQSIRKSKKKKKKGKYIVILKISGMVPSTGTLCLMAPEYGVESQRRGKRERKGNKNDYRLWRLSFWSETLKKCLQKRWIEKHLALDIGNNEYYMEEKMSTSYPIS